MEIAGKRAAVTGAGGFIGSATARRLADEGADVVGLDLNDAARETVEAAGAEFALADVTDAAALEAAFAGVDLVVHTAAYVQEYGTMKEFVRVNVGGTANVLEQADAAGVSRVLHLSSVVVYGYDNPDEQDESAYRRAVGVPYIDTKSSSDRLACRRGAVVIRPGDVYGPGGRQWVVRMYELAKLGMAGLPGKGDGLMLPVYIDDLVEAIICGLRRGVAGQAYTAWSGEPVPFEQLVGRYAELAGTGPVRRLPRPLLVASGAVAEGIGKLRGRPPALGRHSATFIDRRGIASNRRAREELGWEPKVDFEEGMRRVEEWLRAEGLV